MPDHKTITIWVKVDVDEGIADAVTRLNSIPGVRTHASCQGTIGEDGPAPYRPQVLVTFEDGSAKAAVEAEFDLSQPESGKTWWYAHPRQN